VTINGKSAELLELAEDESENIAEIRYVGEDESKFVELKEIDQYSDPCQVRNEK
jgi:hypothetical protein